MPFNPHFEMEARLQFSTANIHTGVVQIRPKFELPVGEMFIETDVMYRAVARNRIGDITAALGVIEAGTLLIFSLLYTPCVAAIATVKRELGKLSAFLVILMQCSIAWFVAFIVYNIVVFR